MTEKLKHLHETEGYVRSVAKEKRHRTWADIPQYKFDYCQGEVTVTKTTFYEPKEDTLIENDDAQAFFREMQVEYETEIDNFNKHRDIFKATDASAVVRFIKESLLVE